MSTVLNGRCMCGELLDTACNCPNTKCVFHRPAMTLTLQPLLTGWLCPVCGAGVSPFVNVCPCQTPQYEVTWSGNSMT